MQVLELKMAVRKARGEAGPEASFTMAEADIDLYLRVFLEAKVNSPAEVGQALSSCSSVPNIHKQIQNNVDDIVHIT